LKNFEECGEWPGKKRNFPIRDEDGGGATSKLLDSESCGVGQKLMRSEAPAFGAAGL